MNGSADSRFAVGLLWGLAWGGLLLFALVVALAGAFFVEDGDLELCTTERVEVSARRARPAPSPGTPRHRHGATLLRDGRLLIAGGVRTTNPLDPPIADTELFDPRTDTWSPGPPMSIARRVPRLVVLHDGDVLAIGGTTSQPGAEDVPAERLHLSSGRWQIVPQLLTDGSHTGVVALTDGRVFVAGPRRPPRVFDPATSEIRSLPRPLPSPRSVAHEDMLCDPGLLADGRVAVLSGDGNELMLRALDADEGAWQTVGMATPLEAPKSSLDAVILPDARFIADLGEATIVDPQTGTRQSGDIRIAGSVALPLVFGGAAFVGGDAFEPWHRQWSAYDGQQWITGRLHRPRSGHSVTELGDRTLLVVGGSCRASDPRARTIALVGAIVALLLIAGLVIATRSLASGLPASFWTGAVIGAAAVVLATFLLLRAYAEGISTLSM